MDILTRIAEHKTEEVARLKQAVPFQALDARAAARESYRSLYDALASSSTVRIIAEIKRASPSKGMICETLEAGPQAARYAAGGAAAISVLTETTFFLGSVEDLKAARRACELPVLRKDFTIDPYQVVESAAIGADAILLIVRMLGDAQLNELAVAASEYKLDALVEVHDEADLERAQAAGARLIGINNRNLKTFDTSLDVAVRLADGLRPGQIAVAASGVSTRHDVERNLAAGLSRFLVGESLVCADDPVEWLATLRGVAR